MKPTLAVLVTACMFAVANASAAHAQDTSDTPSQRPPKHVHMHADDSCAEVHPGDTVHFTLTIENVEEAKTVLGDLRMRQDGHLRFDPVGGLPHPDFRNLGGGGTGVRDPQDQKQYAFAFVVPEAVLSGIYRGVGVYVTTNEEAATHKDYRVGLTPNAQNQVSHYCLNVMSTFGGTYKPLVTNFKPGPIDPKK